MQISNTNAFPPTHIRPSTERPSQARNEKDEDTKPTKSVKAAEDKDSNSKQATELDQSEKRELAKLKARDAEVRAHEAAHKAAGGQYITSGASFSYQRGPDGQNYAVGGEVGISTSPIANDPEATLQKANQIRAAALAPAQPSGKDRSVASAASQMAADARIEISKQNREEIQQRFSVKGDDNEATNHYKQVEKSGDTAPPLFDQRA